MNRRRFAAVWVICLAVAGCASLQLGPGRADVSVKLIAFNDFHGNLQSPGPWSVGADQPAVTVGGADYLAAYVAQRVSLNRNHVVVAAGDLVGASPLVSAAYHDEGTVQAMNLLGLELTSVGNHEFDAGPQELLRKQSGGCAPAGTSTCLEDKSFQGAAFKYLAANVVSMSTGRDILPPYAIKTFEGVRVAFIGVVLKATPSIVLPSGVAGARIHGRSGQHQRTDSGTAGTRRSCHCGADPSGRCAGQGERRAGPCNQRLRGTPRRCRELPDCRDRVAT